MARSSTTFKPGLRPPEAGRKKGTPNKRSTEFQKHLDDNDFSVADELMKCYWDARQILDIRSKSGNLAGALEALSLASRTIESMAQYIFPKKKAIEHSGEVGLITFADIMAAAKKSREKK